MTAALRLLLGRPLGRPLARAASSAALLPGGRGARACLAAILLQHRAFLGALEDEAYAFVSPVLQASVGQHTRHSLDHVRKPVELLRRVEGRRADEEPADGAADAIQYDVRQRNTEVERSRAAALDEIDALLEDVRAMDPACAGRPVRAAFMLSASGEQFAFDSTLGREIAFAVHHCIHHNALSKVLLRLHFPHAALPEDFGMAPSTTNYMRSH